MPTYQITPSMRQWIESADHYNPEGRKIAQRIADARAQVGRGLGGLAQALTSQAEDYTLRRTTSGALDMHALASLAVDPDHVWQQTVEGRPTDTAVSLCLDASGSMQGVWPEAVGAAAEIHATVSRIPGAIASVGTFGQRTAEDGSRRRAKGGGTVYDYRPIAHWGEPTPGSTILSAVAAIGANEGTFLSGPLWAQTVDLMQRPERRRIALLITDGETYEDQLALTIRTARQLGIEPYVMAWGASGAALRRYLRTNFGGMRGAETAILESKATGPGRDWAAALVRLLARELVR